MDVKCLASCSVNVKITTYLEIEKNMALLQIDLKCLTSNMLKAN
jgi:hypothetical protein